MQREIKKKTLTYGITAVFLALILTTIVFNVGVPPYIRQVVSELKTFTSYSELENFLKTGMEDAKRFNQPYFIPFFSDGEVHALSQEAKAAPAHSTTNIQVAGVDEADIVKTDGNYLYVVCRSTVYIVQAYPPSEAKVLSKVVLNETYDMDIYVNGNKLVVLTKRSTYLPLRTTFAYYYDAYAGASLVKVYDITNKTNPVLKRTVSLNGTLMGSRMIDGYVYIIANQMATNPYSNQTEVILPEIEVNNEAKVVQPTEVRYLPLPDIVYYFTTVVAINVTNDAQEPTYETLLTGATTSMYVSQDNMYLTVPDTTAWIDTTDGPKEETIICRAKLDKEDVVFEAQGSVSGYVLNQFSMDEYDGFFRIAATTGWGSGSVNNLYVLDMNLDVVGKLTGIAPGESIYSVRFMGDRGYLVTFRQIDPFFVIDLSAPTEPKILGFLEIPGFSGYLHPYDADHIIGIGVESHNVKLSLYDVTNVSAPIEMDKFIVPAEYSSSEVLTDHKAFLFDKAKQLLALPVTAYGYTPYNFWQGAYVFNVTLNGGFVLKGTVTHIENSTQWWNNNYYVQRTLYIDNTLYTVSNAKVKINSLTDLSPIKTIDLN